MCFARENNISMMMMIIIRKKMDCWTISIDNKLLSRFSFSVKNNLYNTKSTFNDLNLKKKTKKKTIKDTLPLACNRIKF